MKQKAGLSIIEVIFAISFLAIVGIAMLILSTTALRLSSTNDRSAAATSLNQEALTVVMMTRRADANFAQTINSLGCSGAGCYLSCPSVPLSGACQLSATASPIVLGDDRTRYQRQVKIEPIIGEGEPGQGPSTIGYAVQTTTSWGAGLNRKVSASARID